MYAPLNVFRRIYSGEFVSGKLVSEIRVRPLPMKMERMQHVNCDIVKCMVVWSPHLAHTISINLTGPSNQPYRPTISIVPPGCLLMVVAVINLRAVAISMPINGSPTFQKKE